MGVVDALVRYARRVRELRRAHAAVAEPALAPAFQDLLTDLLSSLPTVPGVTVVPEFQRPSIGRPDIALIRAGQPARAFVELKAIDKPASPARWRSPHDKRQAERLRELPCWATSNFVEFLLFERAREQGSATLLPARALDPTCTDAAADSLVRKHDASAFVGLVERLIAGAGEAPAATSAKHLAELLAHSARLVRGIIHERLGELREGKVKRDPLLDVHAEFQTVLYAHPEAGGYPAEDFDALFSSAFAQTLAFGLLLVREGSAQPVGATAHEHMPSEHPLMRTALRVLTLPEILDVVGVGFTVLLDTVNSFTPEILAVRKGKPDPILYFYEDFLSVFDPVAREQHGVYFTPVEVVRFMVGALDRAAREHLGLKGLRDPKLTILDPATGTGTFLLGVAERVRDDARAAGGDARARLELQDLAGRMYGLELLIGPYAVAHYRLHHALHEPAPTGNSTPLPRLGVYLTDTLSEPGAGAPLGRLGFVSAGISDERKAADRVKAQKPILAIIGNPPYRRLEEGEDRTLVGAWMNRVWDDLKAPVRDAGQGNQLNTFPELSVAFWRWAIWKLFESDGAPKRGVVAFITNRKFLTGWPYAGLRRMMRERFDRIEIIDLRGDIRRGPRAGVVLDEGVFEIKVGTAITVAVADGSRGGELADVRYLDSWSKAHLAGSSKLEWLSLGSAQGGLSGGTTVDRGALEDFRVRPFLNGEWPSLQRCFEFSGSGMQTKRDRFVYDCRAEQLQRRIESFLSLPALSAAAEFHETRDRTAAEALRAPFDPNAVRLVGYRPLDGRYLYLHNSYGDFLRPELQRVWGANNVAAYALPGGTGAGPAVWCHGLLPDYHSFRGSYGGYAFPLHDRRPEVAHTNISAALLEGLAAAYGTTVDPEQVFDSILCLLTARSYTLRFAEDLEDVFPHVPFPADREVFLRAAALGARIRRVETFDASEPLELLSDSSFVRLTTVPTTGAALRASQPDGSRLTLCADGSGKVDGVPTHLWAFEVSGYPVLRRWLEGRDGEPMDLALFDAFRDVCARIAELMQLAERADLILEDALEATLNRDVLEASSK